jgi:hypothetical protein
MKLHTTLQSEDVQIGRDRDYVLSVHFRNDGVNSKCKIGRNGVYITLRPGEEKEFGVPYGTLLDESFKIVYEFENQSPLKPDGTHVTNDAAAEAEMVHLCVIGEMFIKGVS